MSIKTKTPIRTLAVIAEHKDRPDNIVEAGETVKMIFPAGQKRMTLKGAKLFHLLIQNAGVKIAEKATHRVRLSDLNETFHRSKKELNLLVMELQKTLIEVRLTDGKGREYPKRGPILTDTEQDEHLDDDAELRYKFSDTMRYVVANSTHWTVLSRQAVMAFDSSYALRLYTFLSLKSGMHKQSEDISLDNLRDIMGCNDGRLAEWKEFRRNAVEPAISEINQLAGFHAEWMPIKHKRRVVAVRFAWRQKSKDEVIAAMIELERHRAGRKARRVGTAEYITDAEYDAKVDMMQREGAAIDLNPAFLGGIQQVHRKTTND